MSQTILIEDRVSFRKIYHLNLKSVCDTDVIVRESATDAIALLTILPNIDLIILRSRIEEEYTSFEIINFLKQNDLSIPIIIIGESPEFAQDYLVLKEDVKWEHLVEHSSRLLGITEQELQKKVKQKYIPIDISYFYEIQRSPCDVFIRLKKGAGEYNYIKRLNADDNFQEEDINKYSESGLRFLYIDRDYKEYFVRYVTNELIEKIEGYALPPKERLAANSKAYSIIQNKIEDIGIDEEVAAIADASIKSMIVSIKETPKLSELLKLLLSDKVSFAYQKSHLLCVIGDFILSKQSWYKKSHLDIFAFCAFFSDITLKSRKQILIRSQKQLELSDFSQAEKDRVYYHAKETAEICSNHPDYSSYINIILTQHHGSMTGEGFELANEEELHPISKIFIVADHFVSSILSPKKDKDKKAIIDELHSTFAGKSFKKIISILEKKIS